MTNLPFPELNGSLGMTGVVQGWTTPWDALLSGYLWLILTFVVFYALYVKMDNPTATGLVMFVMLGFLYNKLPNEQLAVIVVLTSIALGTVFIRTFIKTHF